MIVTALVAIVGIAYVVITHASGPYVFLSPSTASPYVGSTFDVRVYEQSGTAAVNAVQANILVPAGRLSYVRTDTSGSGFDLGVPTTLKNGSLDISAGSTKALTGQQLVATVTFKALAAGSTAINFGAGSSILRANDSVNLISFTQGVTYTLKTPPTAATYMAIYPPTGTVSATQTPQIGVSIIEQTGSQPMNVFQTALSYPTNLLSYDHVKYYDGFSQGLVPSINNGVLTFVGSILGGQVTGPQLIATAYFNIKAAGTAKFSIGRTSEMINATTAASYLLKKP